MVNCCIEHFLRELRPKLSNDITILTEDCPGFRSAYQRWSDIDRKKPAAVVYPKNENDVAILVRSL